MRSLGLALGLLAAALPVSTGSAERPANGTAPLRKPMRVMSLNTCTDQLVLELLPPERIASVTMLSLDPGDSLMAAEAKRVAINHGLAEEVVRQKPDLVIASPFSTPAVRSMLKRLNYPMIEVGAANSFDDIRSMTRQVAAAVGEVARGEALIAEMDAKLAALARAPHATYRIAAWDRFGFGSGAGTLPGAIFEAAGAHNVAADPPASNYGRPDAEVLLEAAPPLLVQGAPGVPKPSLGDDVEAHRVVRRFWSSQGRMLNIPQAYYVCGTPRIAEAVRLLREQLKIAAARANTPLPFAGARQ
ncbi:ABC transporter substrate-binding protein [Sphingomonas sp. KR3-1]|uniref:ABC transporter substrate-binding protein n=1 Tax=Sphingomonas sp. KR3-1 TaxID=3156611 RepID=UPI0032B3622A